MKREYIKKVFEDLDKLKTTGIYFSGIRGEGKFKKWKDNSQLGVHCFYKNGILNGECKRWDSNGNLYKHCVYKNAKIIKDYLK